MPVPSRAVIETMKTAIHCALLGLFVLLGQAAWAAARIAYVYREDVAARDDFAAFLSENGYAVDAVAQSNCSTFAFAGSTAIIVGADTATNYASWGTPAAVSNIAAAGKTIIGIAFGGGAFFGQMGLHINAGQAWGGGSDGAAIVDAANPVWSSPHPVPVTAGDVTLYSPGSYFYAVYDPYPIPGEIRIARQRDDDVHYPLIAQYGGNSACLLWGFGASPATFTPAASNLFLNCLEGEFLVPYAPKFSAIAVTGAAGALSLSNLTLTVTTTVQRATTLKAAVWTNVATFVPTDTATNLLQPIPGGASSTFYRVTAAGTPGKP